MDDQKLKKEFSCRRFTTLIIGTGAAGYNAADELWSLGQRDIAIVTDLSLIHIFWNRVPFSCSCYD